MNVNNLRKGDRVYYNGDINDRGTVLRLDSDGQILIRWDSKTLEYRDESGVYGWFDPKNEHLIDLV